MDQDKTSLGARVRHWRIHRTGRRSKALGALLVGVYEDKKLKFAEGSEPASMINFCAVYHLNWKRSVLKAVPFSMFRQSVGAVGTKVDRCRNEALPLG
jgi:hypothetical protein